VPELVGPVETPIAVLTTNKRRCSLSNMSTPESHHTPTVWIIREETLEQLTEEGLRREREQLALLEKQTLDSQIEEMSQKQEERPKKRKRISHTSREDKLKYAMHDTEISPVGGNYSVFMVEKTEEPVKERELVCDGQYKRKRGQSMPWDQFQLNWTLR
jgi:uncharacterized protein YkwD